MLQQDGMHVQTRNMDQVGACRLKYPDVILMSESKKASGHPGTVPWEDRIEEAHEHKRAKFAELSTESWNNGLL